jgi:hypothetical protein
MGMPMEMVARLRDTDEPIDGFQSLMGLGIIIVDSKWGRMSDKNIEGATVLDMVQQEAWKHAERSQIRIRLGMLVCSIRAVANGPAKPADQIFFNTDQPQIQVGTAFHARKMIFGIISWVMIARHIKQGNVQHRQQVFKVRIRQISTAEDHFDLAEVATGTKAVEPIYNLITDCKDFHNVRIVPQNELPCKGRSV